MGWDSFIILIVGGATILIPVIIAISNAKKHAEEGNSARDEQTEAINENIDKHADQQTDFQLIVVQLLEALHRGDNLRVERDENGVPIGISPLGITIEGTATSSLPAVTGTATGTFATTETGSDIMKAQGEVTDGLVLTLDEKAMVVKSEVMEVVLGSYQIKGHPVRLIVTRADGSTEMRLPPEDHELQDRQRRGPLDPPTEAE